MKSIKLQTIPGGYLHQLTPQAPVGPAGSDGRTNFSVIDVPDHVPCEEVLRLFAGTTCISPENRNYTLNYSEIGCGHILLT